MINVRSFLHKKAYIRKTPNKNEWCVFSEKGKNLGCGPSEAWAKKRLKQIHYFKHKEAAENSSIIDDIKESLSQGKTLREAIVTAIPGSERHEETSPVYKELESLVSRHLATPTLSTTSKKAQTYTSREQEEIYRTRDPYEEGNDIGVSHTFPSETSQSIPENYEGEFTAFTPERDKDKAITPYTGSPADFNSAPMNTIREGEFEYGADTNFLEGEIYWDEGDFKDDASDEEIFVKLSEWMYFKFRGLREIYLDDFIEIDKDDMRAMYEIEDAFTTPLAKDQIEKEEEIITLTNNPSEKRLVSMFDKINPSLYHDKEYNGTVYKYATLPLDRVKEMSLKEMIDFKFFEYNKSGMPQRKYIYKIIPDRLLIIK